MPLRLYLDGRPIDRSGAQSPSMSPVDVVVMSKWSQTTKRVPLGWKAGAGLLHDWGLVADGDHGPDGVFAVCRKSVGLPAASSALGPPPMWNIRYAPVLGCRSVDGLWHSGPLFVFVEGMRGS